MQAVVTSQRLFHLPIMKKLILSLFVTFLTYLAHAQQETALSVESKIEEVTVYLDGAEVKSTQAVKLSKGRNVVTVNGLSPFLEERSIQVTTKGDVEIVSLSTTTQTIPLVAAAPSIKRWNDTLTVLKQKIDLLTNQIQAYDTEKKLLAENQNLGGRDAGVPVAEIMKAADFYYERTLKINNSLSILTNQIKNLTVRLDSATAQIEQLKGKANLQRKQITLVLASATEQKTDFQLKYVVRNASWQATYDLIATDIAQPVSLKYNALIYNNTSIDWKDARLTLSTGDPSIEASRPYLTTWNLNYQSNANEGIVQNQLYQNRAPDNRVSDKAEVSTVPYEEAVVAELAATFKIDKSHTIPADSEPYLITVSNQTLDATYEYLTIPKVDMSAFLIAKVTGWQKLNLIDGKANVYFGNTYIGESAINTRLIGDTLDLSLGRDNQVVVKRAKLEDFAATKSIGGKKVESLVYEISVKNNNAAPIHIKIQDQIPVSQESDISVETEEMSGAAFDAPSGRLQWLKKIAPAENAKCKLAFSVKYPKNKPLSLRKERTVRSARFRTN